jgi:putative ABC transport system ATP-binding protein
MQFGVPVAVTSAPASDAGELAEAVRLDSVVKTYGSGDAAVAALRGVSVGFPQGSFTAVMGPSGSGKSTLLHCASGLDRPTAGAVRLGGLFLEHLSETELTIVRRERVGFVFQAFNLLAALTAEQNITLPLRLAGRRPDQAWQGELVARMGLAGQLRRRPAELSGGQQQRVAIARALLPRPDVVFADEPTGALDMQSGAEILALLREAVTGLSATVVMVTHDPVAASYADRVLFLADGQIVDDSAALAADLIAARVTGIGAGGRRPC